jgi:hypothetical protein
MGDSKRKEMKAGEYVLLDFAAIGLRISSAADIDALSRDEPMPPGSKASDAYTGARSSDKVEARCFALVAKESAANVYRDGMERRDSKVWGAWLDVFDDVDAAGPGADARSDARSATITRNMLDWLAAVVDKAKVRPALAAWRESIAEYLQALKDAPAVDAPAAE